MSVDDESYHSIVLRCAHNCRNKRENAHIEGGMSRACDSALASGTLMECIERTEAARDASFDRCFKKGSTRARNNPRHRRCAVDGAAAWTSLGSKSKRDRQTKV